MPTDQGQQVRSAFFISDRTGITAEMLGQSLLSQFDRVNFHRHTLPYVDTEEKARAVVMAIDEARRSDGVRPVVFSTLVNSQLRAMVHATDALILDFFEIFIAPLELELSERSSHTIGRSHSAANIENYDQRIAAVNYAMSHDDGVTEKGLDEAELILVGVSRSGKTPTSLYLALQFGIKAANYPVIPEDLAQMRLPPGVMAHKSKIWGLTIEPQRLHQIRSERRRDSRYASLANCRYEVQAAEALLRQNGIRFLDSTNMSIEELSTTILHQAHLVRHVF